MWWLRSLHSLCSQIRVKVFTKKSWWVNINNHPAHLKNNAFSLILLFGSLLPCIILRYVSPWRWHWALSTHRRFTETVCLPKKVGIFKGRGASPQLLWQVPVKALGRTRRGRPARALPALGQLQVLHLLSPDSWEVSTLAKRGRQRSKRKKEDILWIQQSVKELLPREQWVYFVCCQLFLVNFPQIRQMIAALTVQAVNIDSLNCEIESFDTAAGFMHSS